MENHIIVKAMLMLIALTAAFGCFFKKRVRLFRIMMAVNGSPASFVDRLSERIEVLFTDVPGQASVRRKFMPGMAHTLIFFQVSGHSAPIRLN